MKKTERLIAAITTIALGILLIVLKGTTVQIITSIFGVLLLVLGVLDLIAKETRVGIVKGLIGIFILAFGWLISSIILYVVSVVLLIAAVWWIYELWRARCLCSLRWSTVILYAQPILLALIGTFLLFHQGEGREWVFVVAGIFTVAEGALAFASAVRTIE